AAGGVNIIVFGQVFYFLKLIPPRDRARFILSLFLVFCLSTLPSSAWWPPAPVSGSASGAPAGSDGGSIAAATRSRPFHVRHPCPVHGARSAAFSTWGDLAGGGARGRRCQPFRAHRDTSTRLGRGRWRAPDAPLVGPDA